MTSPGRTMKLGGYPGAGAKVGVSQALAELLYRIRIPSLLECFVPLNGLTRDFVSCCVRYRATCLAKFDLPQYIAEAPPDAWSSSPSSCR